MPQDADDWLARRVQPDKTALLVIDYQNDFCAPGGFYDRIGFDLSMGGDAVERTIDLLPAARSAGLPVIFFRCIYDRPFMSPVMIESFEHKGFPTDFCLSGTWGAEFFGVCPEPGDTVIDKHRFSCFINTPLDALLRGWGIENLLLTGVATNICVDSTAREGMMRDYRITIVEDCCGSYDRTLHEATLENVRRAFGVIATSDEVTRQWALTTAP